METTVSVDEYRSILKDFKNTNEQIRKRIQYLEAFYRNIIRNEIQNYAKKQIKKGK